jgi:hypothetical protein
MGWTGHVSIITTAGIQMLAVRQTERPASPK